MRLEMSRTFHVDKPVNANIIKTKKPKIELRRPTITNLQKLFFIFRKLLLIFTIEPNSYQIANIDCQLGLI